MRQIKAHNSTFIEAEAGRNKEILGALRLLGWNALLLAAGLASVATVGEIYFRVKAPPYIGMPARLDGSTAAATWFRIKAPFMTPHGPVRFVPKVGLTRVPNTEIRWTNRLDFWTVSRVNSLGFVDREPVGPERTAASCHIAMIGDSFVEAREVPIAEKFHVRLEELAARELPHLDITTSAFGHSGAGQVNQLPFYDFYARHLRPKLLALVFVANDFMDNSPLLDALYMGLDPDRFPYVAAKRSADEIIKLRPPDPDSVKYRLPRLPPQSKPWSTRIKNFAIRSGLRVSCFANWLYAKASILFSSSYRTAADPQLIAWAELLSRRPDYESLLAGWQPTTQRSLAEVFAEKDLPPVIEKELDFTVFALVL